MFVELWHSRTLMCRSASLHVQVHRAHCVQKSFPGSFVPDTPTRGMGPCMMGRVHYGSSAAFLWLHKAATLEACGFESLQAQYRV